MADFLPKGSCGLDVETTGLDPEEHQVTAIGLCENGGNGKAEMKFVESPEDEEEVLEWLADRVDELNITSIVTWRPFDRDFVETRARLLGVPNPLEEVGHFDLQEWVKENEYGGEEIHMEGVLSDCGLEGKHLPGRLMPVFL